MSRVKLRIDEASELLHTTPIDERDLIYACLQMRLAIEEVACASLVANRSSFESARKAFELSLIKDVTAELKRLNPSPWPEAISEHSEPGSTGQPTRWNEVEASLAGADWMRLWGKLSELLHMRNPWAPPRNLAEDLQFLKKVVSDLKQTLSSHVVKLAGGEHLVMARLFTDPIQVYVFQRKDNEE